MVKTVSKSILSSIRKLHQVKHRNESGLFIAEGEKLIGELLNSTFTTSYIVCLSSFYERHKPMLNGYDVYLVTEKELNAVSLMQTPNQVLAVVEKPVHLTVEIGKHGLFLMLDGIRDPGNMGTIIRSAEWFGVQAVLCSPDCVDVYSPKVVQGSMGSIFRMQVHFMDLRKTITDLKRVGVNEIIGAVLDGEPLTSSVNNSSSRVLIIGNESFGISDEVKNLLTRKISIPGAPGSKAESLNAAVACGILLYTFSGK